MKNLKLLATTAFALAGISPAFAQVTPSTTPADTDIKLGATVEYTVGTATQSFTAPEVSVKVDRVVRMTLTTETTGSYKTDVTPKKKAWSRVSLKNTTNDTVDFKLAVANADATTAPTAAIYLDATPAGFGPEDANNKVTSLSNVAQEAITNLLIVIDVPEAAANTTTYNYNLSATAYPAGTVTTQNPAPFATSATQRDAIVDTVLGEGAGTVTGDNPNDGTLISRSSFSVKAPALTAINLSKVIKDPVNDTTNPAAMPGAVVRYCIGWQNASNAAATSSVAVTSTLPSSVTLDTTTVKPGKLNASSACEANATVLTGQVVTGTNTLTVTFPSIGAGESAVAIFDAKIN